MAGLPTSGTPSTPATNGDPVAGHRFVDRWEQRRIERRAHPNPLARFGRLLLGILVLVAAIPIGAIPGPGGVAVTLAGLYLLAGEVRWIARMLDWGELRGTPHAERAMAWWMQPRVRAVRIFLAIAVVVPLFAWLLATGANLLFAIWSGALVLLLLLDVVVFLGTGAVRLVRPKR